MPKDFNIEDYIRLNPDIEAYAREQKLDIKAFGLSHYRQFGCAEGRVYRIVPEDFCGAGYLAINEDIVEHLLGKRVSLRDALNFSNTHYKEYGCLIEGRLYKFKSQAIQCPQLGEGGIPLDFKPMVYLSINKDILDLFLREGYTFEAAIKGAYWHFSTFAFIEKRAYR
jgi:hypothetical protein